MDNRFLLFDDYVINTDEKVIGFIGKDIYLEFDNDGIELFEFLEKVDRLYTLEELKNRFSLIDLDSLIITFEEMGLVEYVYDGKRSFDVKGTGSKHRYISSVYVFSCLILLFNLNLMFRHLKDIFVLDVSYYQNPIKLFILMFILDMILSLIHEGGHYIAAHLLGVRSRLNISHRSIIFLVFECKMNGVWLLSKKLRIFPILGGILMDNMIIFITSILLFIFNINSNLMILILFSEYTKMIHHLLIPFKTDLYYLIMFYCHGMKREEIILKIFNLLGLLFLLPLVFIYFIQLSNLLYFMNDSTLLDNAIVVLILILPVVAYLRERFKNA
ncbi:hypothetical protein [Streptococcus sp. NLN64]|uniref:hypothetical protein n=1 Tax=Streptococcus sp. NLN64 TaxID=2822799 RepID=UPI0018C953AE|nr:hypothetical protein [Streptococcus sp. NLN64]MBG9366882.1 hypothetical protein [Streptococcus sp. NLN64]